jgi:uncharacterized protein (TIGR01777 family)
LALSRRPSQASDGSCSWIPEKGLISLSPAGDIDAVVHLAGESIAQRWTPAAKRRIWNSRVDGTSLLCKALIDLPVLPKTLICASGTGFYGSRGEEWLEEDSSKGQGFLPELVETWEAATMPAQARGIRVVHMRFGMVLGRTGGALAKMLLPFRLCAGARLGDGKAYWSWITLDDAVAAILNVLLNQQLAGPINAVTPNPVTNAEFTETLARVLHRKVFLAAPPLLLRLLFGEMANEALLASSRARPTRLESSGFKFRFPKLQPALEHLLTE